MVKTNNKMVPSVLTGDVEGLPAVFGKLNLKYERAVVTIVDGIFADNLSVAVEDLGGLEVGTGLEVHLAVEYPSEYLESVAGVGVRKVWAQVERMGKIGEFVKAAEELSISPRLALDVYTPVSAIDKGWRDKIDGVLILGNRAGMEPGGFDARVVEKVRALREGGFEGEVGVGVVVDEEEMGECGEADLVLGAAELWKIEK